MGTDDDMHFLIHLNNKFIKIFISIINFMIMYFLKIISKALINKIFNLYLLKYWRFEFFSLCNWFTGRKFWVEIKKKQLHKWYKNHIKIKCHSKKKVFKTILEVLKSEFFFFYQQTLNFGNGWSELVKVKWGFYCFISVRVEVWWDFFITKNKKNKKWDRVYSPPPTKS